LEGKDVILQGQTGSGKTLAYTLPLLTKVDPARSAVQAMIIVPTRELSLQIISVLRQLTTFAPKKINVMSVMEGSFNRR
jgi:ATP-dependent RNA helicase DeaD